MKTNNETVVVGSQPVIIAQNDMKAKIASAVLDIIGVPKVVSTFRKSDLPECSHVSVAGAYPVGHLSGKTVSTYDEYERDPSQAVKQLHVLDITGKASAFEALKATPEWEALHTEATEEDF